MGSSLFAYGYIGAVPWINGNVITQGEDFFSDIAN